MLKRGLSIVLASLMAVSMVTACGNAEEAGSQSAAGDAQNASDVSDAGDEDDEDEEMKTVEFYTVDMDGGSDITEVAEKVNEITEEKINVHVNFNLLDFGSYLQQIGLKMAGNERMDLMLITPAPPTTFTSLTSQNQLMDISELLQEYAPGVIDSMGDFVNGTKIGDGIYATGVECGYATNAYVIMRKDILDELGLTEKAQNLSSWSEYEEILDAVYKANQDGSLPEELRTTACVSNANSNGGVLPLGSFYAGEDSFADAYGTDVLGDAYGIISTDEATDTVAPYYESEEYYKMLEMVHDWYQKGYVYKDAALSENNGDVLMKDGVTFSTVITGQVGAEQARKSTTGYDVIAAQIVSVPMGSSVTQTFALGVPITAEEPEAAVQVMNLLYSDADIQNLLVWGIEGKDYTLNDEGEAVKSENGTYSSHMFLWGNGLLSYPAQGQGGDYMERLKAADEAAPISKYLGFSADVSGIANELTAVNNVISQYRATLESGASTDLKADYDTYCQAMKDAGIDKIISAYQEQLNQWLADQGK